MKHFFKLSIFSLLTITGSSCKREPVFVLPPPLELKSWLNVKDTNWNNTVSIFNETVNAKVVSNFLVIANGADTSISVRMNFADNTEQVQQVAFKFRKSKSTNGSTFGANSIENVFIETAFGIYDNVDISVDSIRFEFKNNPLKNEYVIENFFFKAHTTSTTQKNTSFTLKSNQLGILKSYFYLYQKGKLVSTEKELLNVDLKGGGEYAPKPLVDYKPDLKNPNDLLFLSIPTESLENRPNYDIKNALKYNKKGKFFPAESGTINVNSFYFKNSIRFSGKNWVFKDTILNTPIITIDSLNLQFYSMPF
jgi:hypothetical protein